MAKVCCWPSCVRRNLPSLAVCETHALLVYRKCRSSGFRDSADVPPIVRSAPDPREPVVYYLRTRPGIVKIGYTVDMRRRVKELRAHLRDVIAAEPGGAVKEAHRHAQFAAQRQGRSEDFVVTPELEAHMADIRSAVGDPLDMARMQKDRNSDLLTGLAARERLTQLSSYEWPTVRQRLEKEQLMKRLGEDGNGPAQAG